MFDERFISDGTVLLVVVAVGVRVCVGVRTVSSVKLLSSDDETYEVDKAIAQMSVTIKNMLEGKILSKVIDYCKHHHEHPTPQSEEKKGDEKRLDDIIPWDAEFCKVEQATLFELILAANYLDIKPLLDLTCKTVAAMIKGKTPEDIRKTFNIKNDFTPEEEEQVRKENEWCEER